jgi:hypothetical protein
MVPPFRQSNTRNDDEEDNVIFYMLYQLVHGKAKARALSSLEEGDRGGGGGIGDAKQEAQLESTFKESHAAK